MIRDWVEARPSRSREIKKLLERLADEPRTERRLNGPGARPAARCGRRLLAGLRRRAVDAAAVIIFLLSVFMVAQFFLAREVTGKDTALAQLNARSRNSTSCCRWSAPARSTPRTRSPLLARHARSGAEGERGCRGCSMSGAGAGGARATGGAAANSSSTPRRTVSARALAQVEILNQQITALRRQLAALEEALDASEKRDKESQAKIADLGPRLNVALAQRVQEIVALPLGFLRPAAADSRQPAGHPHRRRPFRVPVGSVLRVAARRPRSGRARRTRQAAPAR